MHIIKKEKNYVLFICVEYAIQITLMFLFRTHLGDTLPTRFNFNGTIAASFQYKTAILIPGIFFLMIFHVSGFFLYRFIPPILNNIPLLTNYVKKTDYIGVLLFWYLATLSWSVLLYFFLHITLPIFGTNLVFLLLFLIITAHKLKTHA